MPTPKDFLEAIPDGGSIDWTAYAAKAGSIANFLKFASPQKLSRSGGHVTVDCSGTGSMKSGNATISTAAVITFDAVATDTDATLTNIVGIRGSQGLIGGNVTKASLTVINANDYQLAGTVHVGFPVGDVNFTQNVDANGNPI
jgi:hypothetical protein